MKNNFQKFFKNSKIPRIEKSLEHILTPKKFTVPFLVRKMTELYFYRFGGFAPELKTAWERFNFETRYETDLNKQLAFLLNHESARGTVEQTENVFK